MAPDTVSECPRSVVIDFQTRRILTRPMQTPAAAVPAEPLLQIKPSDLESIVTVPGGFLAWENGSSCDYRVQWDEDGREGSLFLWFPKEQVELWLVRSSKLGLVKLKCYHCRHKTNKSRWMYIHLSKEDFGCGCSEGFENSSRAARLSEVGPGLRIPPAG